MFCSFLSSSAVNRGRGRRRPDGDPGPLHRAAVPGARGPATPDHVDQERRAHRRVRPALLHLGGGQPRDLQRRPAGYRHLLVHRHQRGGRQGEADHALRER